MGRRKLLSETTKIDMWLENFTDMFPFKVQPLSYQAETYREKSLPSSTVWSIVRMFFGHISLIILPACSGIQLGREKSKANVRIWGFEKRTLVRVFSYTYIIYSNRSHTKLEFNIQMLSGLCGERSLFYIGFFDTSCLLQIGLNALKQRAFALARTI
jgi:hypothetical protein